MNQSNNFVYTEGNLPISSSETNNKLECKNCQFAYNTKTIECKKYFLKPDYVLNKSEHCSKFLQKQKYN